MTIASINALRELIRLIIGLTGLPHHHHCLNQGMRVAAVVAVAVAVVAMVSIQDFVSPPIRAKKALRRPLRRRIKYVKI